MTYSELREEFEEKIMNLDELLWNKNFDNRKINRWLSNFKNEKEQIHALQLLTKFIYFNSVQVRNLLVSLYRDIYKYNKIENIRIRLKNSTNFTKLNNLFLEEQKKTLFLGIGNPSESGTHMLYYFRQENGLSKKLFANVHDIFNRKILFKKNKLKYPKVNHYVFIDDFCGSGSQAKQYSKNVVEEIKASNPNVTVDYYMLVATDHGLNEVNKTKFDNVEAVFILDNSFKAFSKNSRIYKNADPLISKNFAENFCSIYGKYLMHNYWFNEGIKGKKLNAYADICKLGYNDCQLLIGFHHNVPDNVLPIIWYDEKTIKWNPIFKRYNKKYSI